MTRFEIHNIPQYMVDNTRKGAKYSVDGSHFFNAGNLAEMVARFHYDNVFEYDKNCVSYKLGSDIESVKASVKSAKASVSGNGSTVAEIVADHLANTPSEKFCYVYELDGAWFLVEMSHSEFSEFMEMFSIISYESGSHKAKARIRTTSGMMLRWFDKNC